MAFKVISLFIVASFPFASLTVNPLLVVAVLSDSAPVVAFLVTVGLTLSNVPVALLSAS